MMRNGNDQSIVALSQILYAYWDLKESIRSLPQSDQQAIVSAATKPEDSDLARLAALHLLAVLDKRQEITSLLRQEVNLLNGINNENARNTIFEWMPNRESYFKELLKLSILRMITNLYMFLDTFI
jgi:hypothetical protein